MPIDKNTQLPITQISGLDINYTNSNSTLTVPRVTNVERDNLVNIVTETEPQGTVKTSTIIFNVDEDAFQGKSKAGWVNFAGNAPAANTVLYDNTGIAAAANTIAIFNNDKGTTIQGSGVAIARVPAAKNENAEVTQLSNIGVLQFGNSTSTLDHASILLNGSSAINLQENQSNTATIISSGLPQGSSSPSATLEINTNEGALLVSRLTTTERDALVSPQDGYICYNTTTKKLNFRQNGKWLEYSDSNNGYLPTKSISADYQATNDDCVIYVQGSSLHVPVNIYLPNTTPGKLWIIKDGRDNASQYPITVYPQLVTRPYTINTDGGYLWLIGHNGDVSYDIINISSTNTGNVVGPTASVDNSVAVFDGVTGKIIKDGNTNIDVLKNYVFRNVKTMRSTSGGGESLVPQGVDVCKITLIGPGGNGGKCVGGYKGCGGGSGGTMFIYLKNLSIIPRINMTYSCGFDSRGTFIQILSSDYTQEVLFKCDQGGQGADGSSSVVSGGSAGAFSVTQQGTIYTANNYTYWGIVGAEGGVATNSGVSGYGGGGVSGVVGNNPGRDATKGLLPISENGTGPNGFGGSGASGEGLNGGIGGYGAIIIEY